MKTTVTILNKEQDGGIFIDAYSNQGFRLNTGFRVIGPCAVFPRSILHWNVCICCIICSRKILYSAFLFNAVVRISLTGQRYQ